ncbi:MAG: S8 family serine peptidase [Chloroflexi bacterium]|nr:S8 family serine peptidase [Chloroflexota bacterium]
MYSQKKWLVMVGLVMLIAMIMLSFGGAPTANAAQVAAGQRFIAVAKSDADLSALRAEALQAGGKIIREMPAIKMLVVSAPGNFKDKLKASTHAAGVAPDRVQKLIRPEMKAELYGTTEFRQRINLGASQNSIKPPVNPDPAYNLPGLLWNVLRIRTPDAWKITTGNPAVKVGVADTGLDFTHSELKARIADVVDLTVNEDPPLCKYYFGVSDADLASQYGGPAKTDWNGHGSWIGGNIAASLDGVGINGIAPNVKLVALKIAQWCGYAYDSTILDAFLYAADHGINIVSISFGGYLDLKDPEQQTIYKQYVLAAAYARLKGTVIVASAGNEHARIGPGGIVLSHGILTAPGATVTEDFFGWFQIPGGVPGVVDVAATGNVVNGSSPSCPPNSTGSSATCKPASDAHQPIGVGKQNQLTYYSNYGPRIDVAAPGGARKFNLPAWDRGGTPGYPATTADGYNAWEDFSITSNWSTQIPCYYWTTSSIFYPNECYSTIQGTSMATPHVSAVLALVASQNPAARRDADLLVLLMKRGAQKMTGNVTPPLSATDKSAGDLTGLICKDGYCHLGGNPISDADAYGAGLVDALRPLTR